MPQFYLRAFARDDFLCLFDRAKKEYRRQTPLNTAVISQYYTTELEGGESDTLVEQMLSQLETRAKPAIDCLVRSEPLSHSQRADLSYFLSFLYTRTPKFEREAVQMADQAHKQLAKDWIPTVEAAERFLAKETSPPSFTAQSFYDFIHQEKYHITAHRNLTLDQMIELGRRMAKDLVFFNWEVVHAPPNRAFITSDSPFGYIVPKHLKNTTHPIMGILSEEISKVIPLAPSIALRIGARGIRLSHVQGDRRELAEINLEVAKECERFLIGMNEDQLRYLVDMSKLDRIKPGTHLKVESVNHPTDPNRSFLVSYRVPAEKADRPFDPKILRNAPKHES